MYSQPKLCISVVGAESWKLEEVLKISDHLCAWSKIYLAASLKTYKTVNLEKIGMKCQHCFKIIIKIDSGQ